MAAKEADAVLAGKLDFLMKLTETSNSALGRELGFDPSYISRMRSGKRGLPRDRFFLEPAAAYFARALQEYPLRKSAAAEAVCPGQGWPETEKEAEKLLRGWLGQDQQKDMERVERLLNGLAAARLLWPATRQPPARQASSPAAFFYGTEGKREAVLRLLEDFSASDAPKELLCYSSEKAEWLSGDGGFARRWREAVLRLIGQGVRIRIIHTVSRDRGEMLNGLLKWLPLYLTGAVEAYYDPRPGDGAFRRTLIVAVGCGALTASAVGEGEGLNLLVTDRTAAAALREEFLDYLALCEPLARAFQPKDRRELWALLGRFEAEQRSRIAAQRLPLGCTLPEEGIASFARRCGKEMERFLRAAAAHLEAQLAAGLTFTELLDLPPVEDVRAGRVRHPLSDYMGYDLFYTPEEFKLHLTSAAALLRRQPNYRVVLTDRIPEGTMLYAKEGLGCIVARLNAPSVVFFVTEEHLVSVFWSYLQHSADLGQSRELVIRHIEEYVESV